MRGARVAAACTRWNWWRAIKPLIDADGCTPEPPQPAYQQCLYGVPGGWYTRDELDYVRETARTEAFARLIPTGGIPRARQRGCCACRWRRRSRLTL